MHVVRSTYFAELVKVYADPADQAAKVGVWDKTQLVPLVIVREAAVGVKYAM